MPIGPVQLPDAVDQDQDYVWVQRQYAQRGSRTRRDQRPIRIEGRQSGQSLALKVGVWLAREVGAYLLLQVVLQVCRWYRRGLPTRSVK